MSTYATPSIEMTPLSAFTTTPEPTLTLSDGKVAGWEQMPPFYCADMRDRLMTLTGVAVLVSRVTQVDNDLYIHFTIPPTEKPFRLECTVTHCNPIAGMVGILTLRSLIDQEQFDNYLATF